MDNAFRYIKDNHGLDTEKTYPYEAEDDKCRYNPKNSGATDKGFVDIPSGDEEALMKAIATIGPVSVAIDASQETYSWGDSWGDGGYIKMARNRDNHCGIATQSSYPLV